MSMTQEEFDLEYPPGSQKRQEKIWQLEAAQPETPEEVPEQVQIEVPEEPQPNSNIPESVWRGHG